MLGKARLVKKQALDKRQQSAQSAAAVTEKQNRALLTQQIVRTTKDWLANNRQQKNSARQTFAALFMNSDTQSTAV